MATADEQAQPQSPTLTVTHHRRLRDVWRSAGWPCQDLIEVDLLAAGCLARVTDAQGRETLRVTDAGVQVLAQTTQRNRQARDAHEALVGDVARHMQHAGRVVWRGLPLRAPLLLDAGTTRWCVAIPDVFSIRNTTVEDFVEPIVHEIKVRRSDLLSDVRNPNKREVYLALCAECWYVLGPGVGTVDDVPDTCGVLDASTDTWSVLRPAPKRAMRLSFITWMALAKAAPVPRDDLGAQSLL
jgi:hypothetical protein